MTGFDKQRPLWDLNMDPSFVKADLSLALCRKGNLQMRRGTRRKWVKSSLLRCVPAGTGSCMPLTGPLVMFSQSGATRTKSSQKHHPGQSQDHPCSFKPPIPGPQQGHHGGAHPPLRSTGRSHQCWGWQGAPAQPCTFYFYSFAKHYFREMQKPTQCTTIPSPTQADVAPQG